MDYGSFLIFNCYLGWYGGGLNIFGVEILHEF